MVSYRKGDFQEALEICREMMPVQERVNDFSILATTYNNLGNLCVSMALFDEAFAAYGKLIALAERMGNRRWLCYANAGIAEAELGLGRTNDALTHSRAAVVVAESFGSGFELGVSRRVLGEVSLRAGRLKEALDELSLSVPLIRESGDIAELNRAQSGLAKVRALWEATLSAGS
jgi:tetratricopeptide (TPR) repeat protein